jgi:hypothetical protein
MAVLLLMLAPAAPGAGPFPLVEKTDLELTLEPAEGRVDLRASLLLAPPEGEGGRTILLELGSDMRVLSARGPGGDLVFRQSGHRLMIFPEPPLPEPFAVDLHLSGVPLTREGEPRLRPEGLLLTAEARWYPRGRGPTELRIVPRLPRGWIAVGSGLHRDPTGRPALEPMTDEGEGWLAAAPGLALVRGTVESRLPLYLAGPGEHAVAMGQKANSLAPAADLLRGLLGAAPAPALLVAELPMVEERQALPGALLLPPGGLTPLLEGEEGGEEMLAGLWWGGMVRPRRASDGRWLRGFASGLASLVREELGNETPAAESRLREEYWALPGEERLPLGEAGGAGPDAAVLVPAAELLRAFADWVGREKLTVALTGVTARYRGEEVGLRELTRGLETRAGLREDDFFGPWLVRSGPARLRLDWSSEPRSGRHEVTVTLRQDAPAVPLSVPLDFHGGGQQVRRTVQTASTEHSVAFMLPFDPTRVEEDPDGRLFRWNAAREAQAARLEAVRTAGRLVEEGLALEESGERRKARRLYQQAVDLDGTHPLARLELGRLLVLDRKIDRSRGVLTPLAETVVGAEYSGLEWARSWAEVWIGRGWDLRRDRRKALDAYRRALGLPGGRRAHRAAQEGIDRPFTLR